MKYRIELTQQEVQIIYMGLGELPIKIGLNVLGKIQQEIAKQDISNAVDLRETQDACQELADNGYINA